MCSGVSTARHSARGGAPEAGRPSVEDRPRGCVLLAAHPITGAVLFESPVVATGRKIQRSQGFWYAAVRGSREDDAVVAGGDRPPSLLAPVSLVARWADRASSPSKVTDEMMAATWVDFKQIKARSRSCRCSSDTARLRRIGGELRGPCPLPTHTSQRSRDSFSVSPSRNVWSCRSQSCMQAGGGRAGGNILDLVAIMDGCSVRRRRSDAT
jgi:hypothetical protein